MLKNEITQIRLTMGENGCISNITTSLTPLRFMRYDKLLDVLLRLPLSFDLTRFLTPLRCVSE